MYRQLWLVAFGLLAILAFFALGCDEPNDPDVPPQPYHLSAVYDPGNPVTDVSVGGDYAAVGIYYRGSDVLNVADLNNISRVDSHRYNGPGRICEAVALDQINTLVAESVIPASGDEIRDFATHTYVSGFGATGVQDMHFFARPDTTDFWFAQSGTDVRITCWRMVRTPNGWTGNPGLTWQPLDNAVRMENFAIRSDGIVAATFQAGIHLMNSYELTDLDTILTSDQAYGCGWYGNYLIVAAEFHMLIIDLTNLQNPVTVQRFEIRNADRLRQVAVDGNYVALLDANDGVYVVDVSNVSAPRLVQTITLTEPSCLAAGDHRLYFGDLARGLLIYTR